MKKLGVVVVPMPMLPRRFSFAMLFHRQWLVEFPCIPQLDPRALRGVGEAVLRRLCIACRNTYMSNDESWTSSRPSLHG